MRTAFRLLLVLAALSTSGVVQVVSAMGDDACCPEEGTSVPDCPPGAVCACCPARSSLPLVTVDVRPCEVEGRPIASIAHEPVVPADQSDIFHPPRA